MSDAAGENLMTCMYCFKLLPQTDLIYHINNECRFVKEENKLPGSSGYFKPQLPNSFLSNGSNNCQTCLHYHSLNHSGSFTPFPLSYRMKKFQSSATPANFPGIKDKENPKCQELSSLNAKDAAGEDLYTCVYCSEKMPQKEKNIHNNFLCKVLIESCGISLNEKKFESSATPAPFPGSIKEKENPKCQELSSLDAKDVTLLAESMKELLIKGSDHDVKIIVKGKEFRAHRSILSARSRVFAMMFDHDTQESSTGTINIEDCDPDSFDEFLLYVYSGRTEDLTPNKALHLYYTADKYDLPALKKRCAILLKTSLSVESICDVIILATRHDEKELLEEATKYFAQNMREILVTVHWQEFLSKNPIEGNELYIKSMNFLIPKK